MGRNKLTKKFDYINEEAKIYNNCEKNNYFSPKESGKSYFIPMPPPNITGKLHLGHAYFLTLQDTIARFKRMKGHSLLWLPGTDHAGLATQSKLDSLMIEQNIDQSQFEQFAANYKSSLQDSITSQIRLMGASCDWSREKFTLDKSYSIAITEALNRCHLSNMLYQKDNQWWLKMDILATRLLKALDNNELEIIPVFEEKTLRHFLNNIEDWCISRQIKWGHQLPIWIDNGQIIISDTQPTITATRETDVLDTWFSSALWPMATLGWPENTEDFKKFYPADLIETGSDILFFWCARMLMMGLFLTDTLPFKTIFLHGLIRDRNGEKMSKSLNNGIDPLELIEKYGTDALRIYLLEETTPGQDMKFQEEAILAARSFTTKLWNASKFCLIHFDRANQPIIERPDASGDDLIILNELDQTIIEATNHLENFRFREYMNCLRHFIWNRFCSFYIEAAKDRLYADDKKALMTLMFTLDAILKLIHPAAPFISERIRASYIEPSLMLENWAELK